MRRSMVCAAAAAAAALVLPAVADAEFGYLRSIPPLRADGSAAPWPWGGPTGLTADRIRDEVILVTSTAEGRRMRRLSSTGEELGAPVAVRGDDVSMTSAADPAAARIFVAAGNATDVYDGELRPLGTLMELAGIPGAVEVVNDEHELSTPADDLAYAVDGDGLSAARNVARFNPITGAVVWRQRTIRGAAITLDPDTRSLQTFSWKGETWGSGSLVRMLPDGSSGPAGELFAATWGYRPQAAHTTTGEAVFISALRQPPYGGATGFAMVDFERGRALRYFGYLNVGDVPGPKVACRYSQDQNMWFTVGARDEVYAMDSRGRIDVFGEGGDRRWCGRNARPEPRLSVTPGTRVRPGVEVTFDPSQSVPDFAPEAIPSDPDRIVAYEWDFDDDGVTDLARTTPDRVVLRAEPGVMRVDLRITDSFGQSYARRATVDVPAGVPEAVLVATPSAARTGETIVLDASRSTGGIARYEWDLDGDGDYEYDTGAIGTRAVRYTEAGTRRVGVRVTATDGQRAEAEATVSVQAFSDPGIPPAAGVEALVPGVPRGVPAAPAARDRVAPKLSLPKKLRAVRGRVTVGLACPIAEQGCLGEARLGKSRALFSAGGGEVAAVRLTLDAATRRAVARGRTRANLVVEVGDAAGNERTQKARVTVAK